MAKAYLLLGSNIGDRRAHLHAAAFQLSAHAPSIHIAAASSVYETAAWGKIEQDDYLNQALEITTTLSPQQLLAVTASIETKMGRIRKKVWEPRIIDIDILFYGAEIIREHHLTIPHPHVQERKFVLMPLAEIAPDLIHPVLQHSIQDLLQNCSDSLWVRKYEPVKI